MQLHLIGVLQKLPLIAAEKLIMLDSVFYTTVLSLVEDTIER